MPPAARTARSGAVAALAFGVLMAAASPLRAQQPATPAAVRPSQLPPLPLTQLDDRQQAAELDTRTFSVSFVQPTPMRDVLMMLVRGTSLSIVPDPDVGGAFIGELKNVTVRRALDTVLPPFGLDYSVDGAVVRVFRRERETRLLDINYIASARTGTALVGTSRRDGSYAQVSTTTANDVFAEIGATVRSMLSDHGSVTIDRKAGLLQATDYPERLDRIANYLDAVQDRVHRQVQIDARIVEVELDETAELPPTGSLRVADLGRFLSDLAAQGKVTTLAAPRLMALNNEPAIVHGAEDAGKNGGSTVTVTVTPQIGDGVITLSLSPIVTLKGADSDRDRKPAIERDADVLARVADGETLVISGFAREHETRERKTEGIRGGWFGRGTVVTKKRVELLVLLTPKIVNPLGTQD